MPVRPHPVAILVLPSVVAFDLAVPMQVFGYPRPDLGAQRYRVRLCAPRAGRVRTSSGFDLVAPHGLEGLRGARTIIVPGYDDMDLVIPPAVRAALQRAAARGVRLVSICTGAFVLADAGLLDGRRATTHWQDAPLLAARHPRVTVDPNVLYVDEGQVLTSAGIACGIDLCLHLVRADHGAAVANAVARRMVVAPHRDGTQAQFVPGAAVGDGADGHASASLEPTRAWARGRLGEALPVSALAAHAGMPLRTFARRFRAEMGTTPLQWLVRERLAEARTLLETTTLPLARVAQRTGFGSEVSLRAHFRRALGTSPAAYRRAFRGATPARGPTPQAPASTSAG
jgi:transcriptional regulator GlxA family with amidase domain